MAGEDKEQGSTPRKLALAKVAAALVGLLLLGVMASGALADGDPFAAITAITGTSPSSDATGTSSTGSDTTSTSTDTTTDTTSTDAAATTDTTTTTDAGATTTDSTTTPGVAVSPSIASDKSDYAPGSTVTLTGSGWGAAELVHLLVNDTIGQTWQYTTDVTADLDGAFTASFQLPNSFVSNYDVTATG
jgi:cytoskeletal protein RodZ